MKRLLVLVLVLALVGCTSQSRARRWGGTATETLRPGQKLVMVTWKDDTDLWILTRPMRADEQPETYTFKQSTAWGLVSGEVIVVESR